MSQFFILRHAKSSWKNPNLHDHDRPLNKRGQRDSEAMGNWAREQGVSIAQILSSDSARTRETTERFAAAYGFSGTIQYTRDLYHCSDAVISKKLWKTRNAATGLLIVAHNPGIEDWVSHYRKEFTRIPTATLIVVNGNSSETVSSCEVFRPKEVLSDYQP